MANWLYILVSVIALILLLTSIVVASIGAHEIGRINDYKTNNKLKSAYNYMLTIAILSGLGILIYIIGFGFIIYDSYRMNKDKTLKEGIEHVTKNKAMVPILAILTFIVVIIVIVNGVLAATAANNLITSGSNTGGSFTKAYNMAIITAVLNLVVMTLLLFSFLIFFYIRSTQKKGCAPVVKQLAQCEKTTADYKKSAAEYQALYEQCRKRQ